MTLGQKQEKFSQMVGLLIQEIYRRGYQCRIGAVYSPPCPKCGHSVHLKSGKHPKRLAIDINLFDNGKYLTKTIDHSVFGAFWERMGGVWGGNFKNIAGGDGNHYEL